MRFDEMFGGAVWIGAAEDSFPVFRKNFEIQKDIAKARIRILGFGSYRFFINGTIGTDEMYLPLNSDFEERGFPEGEHLAHRAYVNEFDVTPLLRPGQNVLAVLLANGWYNGGVWREKPFGTRKLCYSLLVTYTDGTEEHIVSSTADKYAPSYLTASALNGRESHDYTAWQGNCLLPDFDDGAWQTPWKRFPWTPTIILPTVPPIG